MKKLNGSEKQIAWAEDIRSTAIEAMDSVVGYHSEKQLDGMEGVENEIQVGVDKLKSVIENIDSAKYLIDHRNEMSAQEIKKTLASAVETKRARQAVSMLIR